MYVRAEKWYTMTSSTTHETDPLALMLEVEDPGDGPHHSARVTAEGHMDELTVRRLSLNLSVSALLAPQIAATGAEPDSKAVNRAVQVASVIDKAVSKRLKWESRPKNMRGAHEDGGPDHNSG